MKRTRFKSGVYIILNKKNGKAYVGSSVNIKERLQAHKKELQKGIHVNKYLQRAWNKYREENFEFIPILWCSNQVRLAREQELIDKYMSINRAYNMYPKAGSPLGSRHSETTKQKQSKARKEYWENHERPFKEKNPFYKKKHTEKTRTIIGEKNKGRLKGNQHAKGNNFFHTPEEIEKMKNSWTPEMREAAAERGRKQKPPFARQRLFQIMCEYGKNKSMKLEELTQIVGRDKSTVHKQLTSLINERLVYQPSFGYYALCSFKQGVVR